MQAFLGFCNYYGRFVRAIAAPFYTLLCKEVTCYLTNTEDSDMLLLVHCIMQPSCSCPARLYQTILHWEWCIWHYYRWCTYTGCMHLFTNPLLSFSKTLTSSEWNYSLHDCELLAIVTCCKAWRPYIDGQWTASPHWSQTSYSPPHLTFTQKRPKYMAWNPCWYSYSNYLVAWCCHYGSWNFVMASSHGPLLHHPLSCCLTHCNPGHHFGGRIFFGAPLCSLVWPWRLLNIQIYPIS